MATYVAWCSLKAFTESEALAGQRCRQIPLSFRGLDPQGLEASLKDGHLMPSQELLPDAFEKVGQWLPGQEVAEAYCLLTVAGIHAFSFELNLMSRGTVRGQASSRSMLDAWRRVLSGTAMGSVAVPFFQWPRARLPAQDMGSVPLGLLGDSGEFLLVCLWAA